MGWCAILCLPIMACAVRRVCRMESGFAHPSALPGLPLPGQHSPETAMVHPGRQGRQLVHVWLDQSGVCSALQSLPPRACSNIFFDLSNARQLRRHKSTYHAKSCLETDGDMVHSRFSRFGFNMDYRSGMAWKNPGLGLTWRTGSLRSVIREGWCQG